MGYANTYWGMKIRVNNEEVMNIDYLDIDNFLDDYSGFKHEEIEILNEEIELYKVKIRHHHGFQNELDDFRSELTRESFTNSSFMTVDELTDQINRKNLLVAVEGVGLVDSMGDVIDAYNPTKIPTNENFNKIG
jgi:hypothetical protein